jgi:hypothetical protein
MGLDIRIPLGLIFLIIGNIMTWYGFFTRSNADLYARSLDINLNLGWGVLMVIFGGIMFYFGRRQKWQDDPKNPRPWERDPATKPRH